MSTCYLFFLRIFVAKVTSSSTFENLVVVLNLNTRNKMSVERKSPTVLVITGATRCGKTSVAKLLSANSPGERVLVIEQDKFFKESSAMKKVSLQGAPFVNVTFWDHDDCVDWAELQMRVNAEICRTDPAAPTFIIIEGNMLLTQKFIYSVATHIVCVSIDKWTCFDRRSEPGSKRQCYLPYMLEMWKEHVRRFTPVVNSTHEKVRFVDTKAVAQLKGENYFVNLLSICSADPEEFQRSLEDPLYPPNYTPIPATSIDPSAFGVDEKFADSALGMLFGNALGDASGAPFEFHRNLKKVSWDGRFTVPLVMSGRYGVRAAAPGAITDDFQMTLLALKSLVKNNLKFVPADAAKSYIKWASEHPGGIGVNTRALFQHPPLKDQDRTYQKYLKVHRERHSDKSALSQSNGTLMRASAFAVLPDIGDAVAACVKDCAISNDNITSKLASVIYVAYLYRLLHQKETTTLSSIDDEFLGSMKHSLFNLEHRNDHAVPVLEFEPVAQVVLHAIESPLYKESNGNGDMSKLVNDKDKKGFVLAALWVAFRYLKRNIERKETFGETIRQVVCLGGDTDTNAAITGALLGAFHGLNKLRVSELFNLHVLLNVQYDYCTIKNIDNLTPHELPSIFKKLCHKLNPSSAPPVLDLESPSNSTSSTSTSNNKKRNNRNSDDDDDGTEEFDPETVQKEKSLKTSN